MIFVRGELELARDLDALLYGTGDGTGVGVESEYPLYRSPVLFRGGEVEDLPYPLFLATNAAGLRFSATLGKEESRDIQLALE